MALTQMMEGILGSTQPISGYYTTAEEVVGKERVSFIPGLLNRAKNGSMWSIGLSSVPNQQGLDRYLKVCLLDHCIGAGEQWRRDGEAEYRRRFKIDDAARIWSAAEQEVQKALHP